MSMFLGIGLAFIEGLALIISPCILPILPIILAGGLLGNKSRPLGIITGFILTFTIVTLFIRVLVHLLPISPDTFRIISYALLILIGIFLISDVFSNKFSQWTRRFSLIGSKSKTINNPDSGFWGGLLFGGLVGVIWTPCAGPILAAVIVQVATQKTTFASVLLTLSFAIGITIPMLLITFLGRKIITRIPWLTKNPELLRKILGWIIILSVALLIYNPTGLYTTGKTQIRDGSTLINKLEFPYPAADLKGIEAWINSPPLTLEKLRGKVVLIDFWTYSCINCLRTLPYLKAWDENYRDAGLVIIGVHSPEFEFEHNLANVQKAVSTIGIKYPVALDNNFETWQSYHNEYWPAHYLINQQGEVVYKHFGEGAYDVTENNIRYLLGLKDGIVPPSRVKQKYNPDQTPEIYLGYSRSRYFADEAKQDATKLYKYPAEIPLDQWALKGKWKVLKDRIVAQQAGASLKLHFNAGKVYVVMGAPRVIPVTVLVNGASINANITGVDVKNGKVLVQENRLYDIVRYNQEVEGVVELIAGAAGLEIYTFTFGN